MADLQVDPVPPLHGAPVGAGRNVVVGIGIDRYAAWRNLGNAVSDARGTADAFCGLGFVEHPGLLDEAATRDALHALVTDDLRTLGVNDSLIVFFAGHGASVPQVLDGAEVNTGYIIPVDAENRDGRVASWIRLDHWLANIARLPPRHILVIIDACHGGVALDAVRRRSAAFAAAGTRDVACSAEAASSPRALRLSRQVIVSALAGQLALDGGPTPGHSLFTGCLLEALNHGLRRRGDAAVAASEIGLYLEKQLAQYPDVRQTPSLRRFELDNDGELMLQLPRLATDPELVPPVIVDVQAELRDQLAAALAEQFSNRAAIARAVRVAAPRIDAAHLPAGNAAMIWSYVLAELTNAGAFSEIAALVAAARGRSRRSRRFDWSVFSALLQPREKPAVVSWSHVEVEILRDSKQTGSAESILITRGKTTLLEADVTLRWGGARPPAPRIVVTSNQMFGTRLQLLHQITQLASPGPTAARWRVEVPVPAARIRTRWVTVRCDGTSASARRYVVAHRGSLCAGALYLAGAAFATPWLYRVSQLATLLLLVAAGLVLGLLPPVVMHLLWRVTGQRSFRRLLFAWEIAAPIVVVAAIFMIVLPSCLATLVTNRTGEKVRLAGGGELPADAEPRAVWKWHRALPQSPQCTCGQSHCDCSAPAPFHFIDQVAIGCLGGTCSKQTTYVSHHGVDIPVTTPRGGVGSPLHFRADAAAPVMGLTAGKFSADARDVPPGNDATLQLPMLPDDAGRVTARALDRTLYALTFTDGQNRLGTLSGAADTVLRIPLEPASRDEPQEDTQIDATVGKVHSTWVGALDQIRVCADPAELDRPGGPAIELRSKQGVSCRLNSAGRVAALDAAPLLSDARWIRACLASGGSLEIGGIARGGQAKLPRDLPFTHLRVRRSGTASAAVDTRCKPGDTLRAVTIEVKGDRRIEIDHVRVERLDATTGVTCDPPQRVSDGNLQCDLALPVPACGPVPRPPDAVDCALDRSGRIYTKTDLLTTRHECIDKDCQSITNTRDLQDQASLGGLSCVSFCQCQ